MPSGRCPPAHPRSVAAALFLSRGGKLVQGFLFRTQPELSGEANLIFMNLLLTCFNQKDVAEIIVKCNYKN